MIKTPPVFPLKYLVGVFLTWLGPWPVLAQQSAPPAGRPKIGLTLGGGGARGLAHVGLLQALDSAGVSADYVTGTSMGAVVGALYSLGYSGQEVEQIARRIDWNAVLSNDPPLRLMPLPERTELDRYAAQLPLAKGGLRLSGGLIESQELWLTLSELFFPFYRTRSFDDFYRPFRCVATDVVAGEAVVLRQGSLTTAVRASMAIPSVFTPVQRDGRTLVDGFVTRNFPVSDARAMGATYLIGSTVAIDPYTAAQLKTPIDVLLQISSFQDNTDVKKQRALCNLLVEYPLKGYSAGSFAASDALLAIGQRQGRALYPRLRALRDSLDRLYGPALPRPVPLRADSVFMAALELGDTTGISYARRQLMLRRMQLSTGRYYTAPQLSQTLRRAYGTGYFSRLTYTLQPLAGDSVRLAIDAAPAPLTHLGLGLQYNSAVGIGLILNLTTRNLGLAYSTSRVALNLGENPRLRAQHIQYLGRTKANFARLLVQGESVGLTPYDENHNRAGLYTQRYLLTDARLGRALGEGGALGLGMRYEYVRYRSDIASRLELSGEVQQFTSYLFAESNTLNTNIYPTRGLRLQAELGMSYGQISTFQALNTETQQTFAFPSRSYQQARLALDSYHPLTAKATLQLQLQAGLNYHNQQVVANDFVVGGLNSVVRNQLTFAGLPEAGLYTSSALVGLVGYRYAFSPRLFALAKANVLYHDFITSNQRLQAASVRYGASAGLGLKSLLGPIEASLMYSDALKRVVPYFNIGIPFGYQ